jgi:RNA polymerase sigma factor (sigma-70 family)
MADDENIRWETIRLLLEEIARSELRSFPSDIASDLDEFVQETLYRLVRSGYPGQPGRKLLRLIVRRQAIDRVRAKRRFVSVDYAAIADAAPEHNAQADRRAALWQDLQSGLSLLDANDREMLTKFYLKQMTIQQLADEVGVNYSAMAVRLHRIKTQLRKMLVGPHP